MKSFQVMTNIINFTYVWLKRLKILTAHIQDVDTINDYVTQIKYFLIRSDPFNAGSFRVVRVEARSI